MKPAPCSWRVRISLILRRARQAVEQIEILLAGDAEDIFDALFFQALDEQVGSFHHLPSRPFFGCCAMSLKAQRGTRRLRCRPLPNAKLVSGFPASVIRRSLSSMRLVSGSYFDHSCAVSAASAPLAQLGGT